MTDPTEKLMTALKDIHLDARERTTMRHMLEAFATSYRPSPWHQAAVFVARHAFVAVASLAVMASTAVAGIANFSHPGDALYSVRTSVNQKVQSTLTFDDDAKLDLELKQIDQALTEEEIAAQQELQI